MKQPWKLFAAGMLLVGPLGAATVSFPAGNFENGTAANWAPQTAGTGLASTPSDGTSIVGRIAVSGTGSGSLSTSVPAAFLPRSLYVVTVEIKTASLAGASSQMGVAVLDGNGNVIKELTQDQILNALGINLGTVSTLTGDLTALVGKLDLTTTLQNLLATLAPDPTSLGGIQTLLDSLIGADASTVSALSDLLQGVQAGTVDPSTITSLEISQLLGIAQANPIVPNVQAVLTSLIGNDSATEALQNLVRGLAGNAADTTIANNLLTTLVGQSGLVGNVADVLAYALSDPGLLSSLTDTLTQSLLGITNPGGAGGFQKVKLIFSTGTTLPSGAIGIRLSSGASLAVGQSADFDNVTVERFDLATGVKPGTFVGAPVLTVKGKHVRRNSPTRQIIRGTASASASPNHISRVEYQLKGPGAGPNRGFRKAKGTSSWKIVIKRRIGNVRVLIRAWDMNSKKSETKRVFLNPKR